MAGTTRIDFFKNAAAGNSSAFSAQAGKYFFYAEATFSGGSCKLQFQSPQGTWIDYSTAATLSANGGVVVEIPAGQYRAVAATGSAFYCSMMSIPTITTR